MHRSIAANHETAQRTGARIIHACGFDSIPSDLGVWLTAEAARADGAELGRTHLAVRTMKGGFSGGTIDSARTQVDELKYDTAARRVVGDPWALAEGGRPPRPAGDQGSTTQRKRGGLGGLVDTVTKASPVKRDVDNGHFTGPFVMAAFNTRIVARSASLLGYGDGFRYVEYSDYGAGPAGAVAAGGMSVALGAGLAGFAFGPTRALLDRVLPKPGEGPSEEAQANGPVPDGDHGAGHQRGALPHHRRRALRPGVQRHRGDARPGSAQPRAGRRPPSGCRRGAHARDRRWVPRSSTGYGRTGSHWRPSAFPGDRRRRSSRRRSAARAASRRSGSCTR